MIHAGSRPESGRKQIVGMIGIVVAIASLYATYAWAFTIGKVSSHREAYRLAFRINMMKTNSPVSSSESVIFGGVKFGGPIANALVLKGITAPSAIQQAAIAPIMTGLNCIVHAETGSGKTLVYLLPLMKRLIQSTNVNPLQALFVVPTIELARQIAMEITALASVDLDGDHSSSVMDVINEDLVCVLNYSADPLDSVKQPIVIGTPRTLRKMTDGPRGTATATALKGVRYLVLDEVDRLIEALSKYATGEERTMSRLQPSDATVFLESLVAVHRSAGTLSSMQVVAGSATVGRPLRRELGRLFGDEPDGSYGKNEFTVLRASEAKKNARAVSIPVALQHVVLLLQDVPEPVVDKRSVKPTNRSLQGLTGGRGSSGITNTGGGRSPGNRVKPYSKSTAGSNVNEKRGAPLSFKMTAVDKLWNGELRHINKGILFVPYKDDIPQILGMLRFWGWEGVKTLADVSAASGASSTPTTPSDTSHQRELYVLAASGGRGIHIADADCVMILSPPNTMDEYLHMAGRTGRMGNKKQEGAVVTLADLDDLKRMQGWQTPLGIQFKVKYQ